MSNKELSMRKMSQDVDNRIINKIGKQGYIRELLKIAKENKIDSIKKSFDYFKKDIKHFPSTVNKLSYLQSTYIKQFNDNKNNIPIFEIEDDEINYNIKFPVIPYKNFFISANINKIIDGELYGINGMFVSEFGKDILQVIYIWSNTSGNNGWNISVMHLTKDGLLKEFDDKKCSYLDMRNITQDMSIDEIHDNVHEEVGRFETEIGRFAGEKFNQLMRKLIYKINKKEYTTYKKHSNGVYTENKIVYVGDVRSHKRHFWEDSGKFIIPKLPKEIILARGYKIDELVFRNGELRRDIPYTIISEFKIGLEKKQKNKIYDMIKKRIWRCEEKIYKILREIYPDKIIRRHDRRTLKGLELDFNIPELRLGIEYDGEQHFDEELYKKLYGEGFHEQVRRDRMKNVACRRKKIKLVRIKYDEPLNKTHIKKRLKEILR